jgi:hypothetical protein
VTTIHDALDAERHYPGHAASQPREYPERDTIPLVQRVTQLETELGELRRIVKDMSAADNNLREVIARELGL